MSNALSKSGIVILWVALFQSFMTSQATAFQAESGVGTNARLYVVHGGVNVGAAFGGELGVVDVNSGTYTTIGTPVPGAGLTGLAYSANQLYVSTSNHSLAILNLAGGLISERPFSGGGFDSLAGDRVTDLAATRQGDLYAATRIGGFFTLCSVEPSLAELTVVGFLPNDGSAGFHSLAFIGNRLYAHQTSSPNIFHEVDVTTGASINAIAGGVPGGALGLGYNGLNGRLYASECCLGDDNARGERIFSIDPGSGVATQLLDFDDGRRIHDLEFVPIPSFDRGDMYVVHGGANVGAPFGGELGMIDTDTGMYLTLGRPVPGAGLTGLAFSRNRFYASTSNLSLAEIDLSGGLISETPFFGAGFSSTDRVTDLAANSSGRLFASARIGGVETLLRVNPNTAELTAVGPLPVTGGAFQALAFTPDSSSDTLYTHEGNAPGQFDEIDPTTGASVNTIAGGVPGGALGMGSLFGDLIASECCLGRTGELGERIFRLDPVSGVAEQLFDFNDGRRIHDIEFVPQQMYVVHGGANAGAPFGGELGTINISTGGYRTLSTPVPGAGLTGLAFANNRFFISTSNHSLAVTDLSGGLLSDTPFFGGGFDSSAGDRVNDLAIARNGRLYAGTLLSPGGVFTYTLCSVDPATAELTVIGPFPDNGGGFHALSFAGARLFSQQTNFTGPVFDEIDINTGASLNTIAGGVPGGALGLGYSPFFRFFFGSECCAGDDGSVGERIWFFDPLTGDSALYVDYDDDRRIQDIEFVPLATVLRAVLRSVTPTRGTYVSGGIPELDASDNLDYQMRRNSADVQARTEFVIRSVSPSLFPTSMEVTLEGSVFARSTVNQSIELFNYNSASWELIDVRAASRFTDGTVTVQVPGIVSRFVDSETGAMQARIQYRSLSPRQQFASNTDLFLWNIGL